MADTTGDETAGPGLTNVDARAIPTRVLVLGLAHADGTILAAEVYPVAEACNQNPEQVRSCFRRLVGEGLFTRSGEGRDAVFHATEGGLADMGSWVERSRLAYAQDAAGRGWDRRWRLVVFAVPESGRRARDLLRSRLRALGGAPVQNGVYVSAHRWEQEVAEEAERLGISEHVTSASTDDLSLRGESDPRAIAASLWDIERLARRYQKFVDTYRDVPAALEEMRGRKERLGDTDFFPGALASIVDFMECFSHDPLLPPELLPRPWPGREARELLARARRLGVLVRVGHDQPLLFSQFDEVVETLG